MITIKFIDVDTREEIARFYKIDINMKFDVGEEIIVEGVLYQFINKTTSFYKDTDGEQMLISLFLER